MTPVGRPGRDGSSRPAGRAVREANAAGADEMGDLRFDGEVAIVTGAGGNPGLGRSYALLLAARGARVVVNDLGVGPDGRGAIGAGVDAVVAEIVDAGGEAVGDANSVADREGARAIVDRAIETWGRVDIVINNAGIAPFASFAEMSERDIERVIGVHLMGHIWMCRAAWSHMAAQGYGRLVNVSSGVAYLGAARQSIYAAAKLGVVGLTRVLATEGADVGIRTNAIMPAADTLAWQTMLEPEFSRQARANGLVPEVVAPVAAFLAHRSCSLTGKVIQTQAGGINEVFFAATEGSAADLDLGLEHVAARMDMVLDRSRTAALPEPGDLERQVAPRAKPYETAPRAAAAR